MTFWKIYAILVSLILAGIVCIVGSHSVPRDLTTVPEQWWENWPEWLDTLGTTLLIAGTLGVVEKALLTEDNLRQLREVFALHESTTELGLVEVALSTGNFDYSRLILESTRLRIVMNDGRTWFSSRLVDFQTRFGRNGSITEVFLIDPDGAFARIIGEKTGYDLQAQRAKISECVRRLQEEFRAQGAHGVLRIYFLQYYPTYSVVLGDHEAVISLYGVSNSRRRVPTLRVRRTVEKEDLFTMLEADVAALPSASRLHFDSTQPPPRTA